MEAKKASPFIVPYSRLGKWSIRLILLFVLFIALFYFLIRGGQRSGYNFVSNPNLVLSILTAALCAIASFVVGMIGIIKSRERSVFVILSCIVGLFVLMLTISEVFFAHG